MNNFPDRELKKFYRAVLAGFPEEVCGLVVSGEFVPCENVAQDKSSSFLLHHKDYGRWTVTNQIELCLHSHTNGDNFPSKEDMKGQVRMGKPWGISVTDGKEIRETFFWGDSLSIIPLLGRTFRHGITDCYALARDWYRMIGISLPVGPRDPEWWEKGQNILDEGFEQSGFERLENFNDLKVGDGMVGHVGIDVNNHCGVYVGNGCILHHLPNRLSRVEPVHRWIAAGAVQYALRYKLDDVEERLRACSSMREELALR